MLASADRFVASARTRSTRRSRSTGPRGGDDAPSPGLDPTNRRPVAVGGTHADANDTVEKVPRGRSGFSAACPGATRRHCIPRASGVARKNTLGGGMRRSSLHAARSAFSDPARTRAPLEVGRHDHSRALLHLRQGTWTCLGRAPSPSGHSFARPARTPDSRRRLDPDPPFPRAGDRKQVGHVP